MFQFLIGTLKTLPLLEPCIVREKVSIPHRYAENIQEGAVIQNQSLVSIPHRYAENGLSETYLMYQTGVSIPHRYAENRF